LASVATMILPQLSHLIKVNDPLPDALFQLELKEGARVEDRRSGQLVAYEYRPKPPELLGKYSL
jgi:hypothetical protein